MNIKAEIKNDFNSARGNKQRNPGNKNLFPINLLVTSNDHFSTDWYKDQTIISTRTSKFVLRRENAFEKDTTINNGYEKIRNIFYSTRESCGDKR